MILFIILYITKIYNFIDYFFRFSIIIFLKICIGIDCMYIKFTDFLIEIDQSTNLTIHGFPQTISRPCMEGWLRHATRFSGKTRLAFPIIQVALNLIRSSAWADDIKTTDESGKSIHWSVQETSL